MGRINSLKEIIKELDNRDDERSIKKKAEKLAELHAILIEYDFSFAQALIVLGDRPPLETVESYQYFNLLTKPERMDKLIAKKIEKKRF